MKRIFYILFATLAPFASAWNLSGDLGVHDPSMIKDGKQWWLAATGKGVPMKRSDDGKAWFKAAPAFPKELSWWRTYAPKMGALSVWAPDLSHYRGRTWMYYSISSEFGKNISAIGLASCDSMDSGQWRDDGMVLNSTTNSVYNAIDPNLTFDSAGEPWLVFGSWYSGIQLVKINPATMKSSGVIRTLAKREQGIEGASLIYANGYYYLFVSLDICCKGIASTYKIGYGRSKNITGPYLDKQGVDMLHSGVTVLDAGDSRWKGVGGQSVYKDGKNWILVRHGYDAEDRGKSKLLISELHWDSKGWPCF